MKRMNQLLNEESVFRVEAENDQAWQAGDVEGIVTRLTKDAVVISPRGDLTCGHREIHDLFSEFLDGPATGSTHTSRIIWVNFVTDDMTLLDGEALIDGVEFDDESSIAHYMITDSLARRGVGGMALGLTGPGIG